MPKSIIYLFILININILRTQVKMSEWKIVFFIAAAFYFCGNLLFVIFGKADIQPWNDADYEVKKNSNNDKANKLGEI